jgi:hypothetical protein
METKMIAANSEETVWKRITSDLNKDNSPLEYHVLIYHDVKKVQLDIDIDPGGSFESGFESTTLSAVVPDLHEFKFSIHHHDLVDMVSKLFGMQDVIIGYPEFDNKLIIKTNDAVKIKNIFSDEKTREIFHSLRRFTLHTGSRNIGDTDNKEDFVELTIDRGVLDLDELRRIYKAFVTMLIAIDTVIKDDIIRKAV